MIEDVQKSFAAKNAAQDEEKLRNDVSESPQRKLKAES